MAVDAPPSPPPPGYWLNSLSRHPVVQLVTDVDASQAAEDGTIPDISMIAPEPSNLTLDVSGVDFEGTFGGGFSGLDSRHSLVAIHESLAVVCLNAAPPKLRFLNLRKWKGLLDESMDNLDQALEEAEYKELKTPKIKFRVKQIELNETGRYLAVVGEYDVAVVILPRVVWSDNKREVVQTTSWSLGTVFHSPVSKVHWHPLSEKQAHLMVLSLDGALRMYDVAAASPEPENTFHFIGSAEEASGSLSRTNRAGMFGADLDEEEFVSFCLGGNCDKWGAMTVYGLTRSGDVYSLCPVIPKRCVVVPKQLESLQEFNKANQLDPTNEEGYGQYSQTMSYWRTTLIEEMITEAEERAESVSLPGEPVAINLPRTALTLKPKAHGPYLIRPLPDVGMDCREATDIICLETQPLDVVIIAFESDILRVCIDVEGSEPRWHISARPTAQEAALPLLRVHEDIDLGFSKLGKDTRGGQRAGASLVADPRYTTVFYCYHAFGVHSVDVEPWVKGLIALADPLVDDRQLELQLNSEIDMQKESEVSLLISTKVSVSSDQPIVIGFDIITEISLGHSYIMLTSLPQLYGDILPVRLKLKEPQTEGKGSEGYTPALKPPLFQPPDIMRKAPPSISLPTGASKDQMLSKCAHIPTLWAFFELVKARRTDLLDRHYAVLDMERRLNLQQAEMKQQLALLKLWEDLIEEKSGAQMEQIQEQLQKLKKKEYLHRKKLGLMLQILMDETMPLTDTERKWIKELTGLQKAFEEKMVPLKEKLEEQMETLQQERELLKQNRITEPTLRDAPELGESQKQRIEEALKQEYRLLVNATQKMVKLKAMVRRIEDKV